MSERRGSELAIVHCDNHLLAVAKPAGVPVAPDESGDASLLELAREWIQREFEKPGRAYLGLVHRLDRPVSGLVLFARTSKAAARLSAQFRARTVEKTYWGVAAREPRPRSGRIEQWLAKDTRTRVVQAFERERPGALRAATRWQVLGAADDERGRRVLIELVPETGRPHQLRVAAATLGAPLLGDLKYGAREPLPDQSVGLHARALAFEHPVRGERVELAADPPARWWWRFPDLRQTSPRRAERG